MKRWWFVEQVYPACWTWRTLILDGTIDQQSEDFKTYGAALWNAMQNGFSPKKNHCVIESQNYITHYGNDRSIVILKKVDGRTRMLTPQSVGCETSSVKTHHPAGEVH